MNTILSKLNSFTPFSRKLKDLEGKKVFLDTKEREVVASLMEIIKEKELENEKMCSHSG